MREIVKVIDQMLAEIPASEEALISDFRKLQQSARYSAPEMMNARWLQGATLLADHMPDARNEWQNRVVDIWLGRVAACVEG